VHVTVDPHPLLHLGLFEATFPAALGEIPSPDWLIALLVDGAPAPVARSEEIRGKIRDLLRHGGYKPTGRGKPASEYLVRAAAEGGIQSINVAVDACNAVSLASGLPISVVDLDRACEPLRVAIAGADARYVFNPSGQEIDVEGLLCLHDADGPCANAVKDAQRTKTHEGTRRILALVWGREDLAEHTDRTVAWYRELVTRGGGTCADVEIGPG